MVAAPTELGDRSLLSGAIALRTVGPPALAAVPLHCSASEAILGTYTHASPAVCVSQTGRATRQREMEIGLGTEMKMEQRQQDPHGGTDVREPVMFLDPEPSFVLDIGHDIRVYACGWR